MVKQWIDIILLTYVLRINISLCWPLNIYCNLHAYFEHELEVESVKESNSSGAMSAKMNWKTQLTNTGDALLKTNCRVCRSHQPLMNSQGDLMVKFLIKMSTFDSSKHEVGLFTLTYLFTNSYAKHTQRKYYLPGYCKLWQFISNIIISI